MGDPCKVEDVLHEKGGERVIAGGVVGDGPVSETAESSNSVVCLCLSTWSLTDDDVHDDADSSVVAETMQLDGDSGGPLYELSPLLANLPVRTGLSKYYQGKSQSFTSLSQAKSVEELAKKTTPYNTRMKACRGASRSSICRHIPGPSSKTIAKKTTKRGSSEYQGKKELYST